MILNENYIIDVGGKLVSFHRYTERSIARWTAIHPQLFRFHRDLIDTRKEDNPNKLKIGKFEVLSKGLLRTEGTANKIFDSWKMEHVAYDEKINGVSKKFINLVYDLSDLSIYKIGTYGKFDVLISLEVF